VLCTSLSGGWSAGHKQVKAEANCACVSGELESYHGNTKSSTPLGISLRKFEMIFSDSDQVVLFGEDHHSKFGLSFFALSP
jgi:hypothetical protein